MTVHWLVSLAAHNQRQARRAGDTATARYIRDLQRPSLRPIRYRRKVVPRMNRMAPRRATGTGGTPGVILRPVIGVDIDGTLGDWHQEFVDFAGKYLHQYSGRYTGLVPMNEHLGISKRRYRQVKLAFRQSGLKRAMVPLPGAKRFVHDLRAAGAELWVCTTRPYLRLDNIDPDTRDWLRHNGLSFDGVLFGERKYRDLVRMVGAGRVLGILDDLSEQVEAAKTVGLPAYLLERPHNGHYEGTNTFSDLDTARLHFLQEIEHWKKDNNVRNS